MTTVISVHPLSDEPRRLWNVLKKKQNQQKLDISNYISIREKKPSTVRFVLISDTHCATDHLSLPEGDILLHAGDFTNVGRAEEVEHFNNFLGREKHKFKHIVVISGNHELTFDPNGTEIGYKYLDKATRQIDHQVFKNKLTNCTYIEDEAIHLMGFNIYGSPWQPRFRGGSFNLNRGKACLEKWNAIPDDTDILLTHAPPLGYGDLTRRNERTGCSELLSTVQRRVKPMLHVFGHIHEGYGIWTDKVTIFANVAQTFKRKLINAPMVVDLKAKV